MKKLLIVLAFASASMVSMAQEADPTLKYSVATNSFWSNWFIELGVNWKAWYSNEEHGNGYAHSPLKGFRAAPGGSIALGKWFTPGLGLRTKVQGLWGRSVNSLDADKNKFKYWNIHEQVLFNVSNMLCGYSQTRVWNVIPFFGTGFSRNCDNNNYAIAFSAGVKNTWRCSDKVGLYLELGWNNCEEDMDGVVGGGNGRIWDSRDNQIYGELGLTINLGKGTWDKTPDVDAIKALSQAQIDALNAQLADANAENARLRNLLANQKTVAPERIVEKTVKELAAVPVSVFFNIDRSVIASRKDLVSVRALAEYAKENDATLLVTGYADSKTGTPAYNQKLSERRAETVANEIVKMGVSRDNIETAAKGGVNDLSPISYNRRAVVEVKK